MKIQLAHAYNDIICLDNLFYAWQEFVFGKKSKLDVQTFSLNLMDNILALHEDLSNMTYRHGGYQSFYINDPKRRHIHKASVRDRLLHHAVHRLLYPFFDGTFIFDSYSCRVNKGTHKTINRFRSQTYTVSRNNTRTCWALKCDVRKFFASVDHTKLVAILSQYIPDKDILSLLKNIIDSFHTSNHPNKGLPLGNLTSQLFINVYMNEFDQWVKHKLKVNHYIRYADDFIILAKDKEYLEAILPKIDNFLEQELNLALHPDKITIETLSSGVDYLGWKQFVHHRALRAQTRKRMFARIKDNPIDEALKSYLGLLKHGNTHKIRNELMNLFWLYNQRDDH